MILGGGFAGLYAARAMRRAPVRITLLDKRNHHLFQPLLYQVATAALSSPDIASPLRKILRRQRNATVLLAEATAIDAGSKRVVLADGEIDFDYLIVATGATHDYFGHADWAQHAPGLKSLDDALEIRRRLLLAFERAEREADPVKRRALLTFVVIGAGPTGVELAGALAEIARHTLAEDFRHFDPGSARVVLLDAADRVLPPFEPALSARAEQLLTRLGVEVRTGTPVTGIDGSAVQIGDDRIKAGTVLWAAGVAASPLAKTLDVPLDRAGRVLVEADLTIPGHRDVFVVGDLAAVRTPTGWVPGVAPAAIQQGRHTAENIRRALDELPLEAFEYIDRGSLATIGRAAGVAQLGRYRFAGPLAWWAWLLVHIFFLIGFRNRFVVLFEWAWAYWSHQRTARIILEDR